MSDLLSDEQLEKMLKEAAIIEARPKPTYEHYSPKPGGPSNAPDELVQEAMSVLVADTIALEQLEDRLTALRVDRWRHMRHYLQQGVAGKIIAKCCAINTRANIYAEIKKLERFEEKERQRQALFQSIKGGQQ